MTKRSTLLLLWTSLALTGALIHAQETVDLVTDRPDQTESAVVVPPGAFQVELGAAYAREEQAGIRVESIEVPGTLLRYGLSERVELRLAWPGIIEQETRTPAGRGRQRGAGDPELGLKASFLSAERGDGLNLALLVHTTLPVGDETLGSPRADPSLRLLGAHELSDRVGLGWNLGYEAGSFEDDAGDRHTLGRFVYTGALGLAIASRWGAFIELFGDLPASDPEPVAHSFDAGVTFLLTPRLQLDFAAGVGLTEAAEDWFAGAGLSFRLPN